MRDRTGIINCLLYKINNAVFANNEKIVVAYTRDTNLIPFLYIKCD